MKHTEAQFRKEVLWCRSGERKIYGVAFLPLREGRHPLVIFSHELGSNHRAGIAYAKRLSALGFAVYAFDFCGGCVAGGRSDGATTEMTLASEQSDLEAVLDAAAGWEFAEPGRTVLMGASQGGVVSALTAIRRPELTAGLILLYPAFSAVDHMHMLFASPEQIPAEFDLFGGWIRLGRPYALDLWDRDFYAALPNCRGRTLLLHGDSDGTVPFSYSRRAAAALPDCEFHVIPGGEHGFTGPALDAAMQRITAYLDSIL